MKNKIIIGLSVLLILLGWFGYRQMSEAKRYKQNWIAEKQERDQERIVTQKELSTVYNIAESLQKQLGLKPKQVERLVQGEISFRDTGRTKEIFIPADTVFIYPDSISGVITSDCYNIDILLYKAVFTAKLDYKDTLSLMMYRERTHKFLFVKYGRWRHRAALYSGCSGSVYKVFNNVSIQR